MYVSGEYVLTAQEYGEALSVIRARRKIVVYGLAAAFFLVAVVLIVLGNFGPGIFCLIVSPIYLLAWRYEIERARVAYVGRSGGRTMVATFRDDAFVTSSPLRTVENSWRDFSAIVETSKFFLLYTDPRFAVIVPKRAFSPQDARQVSELLGRVAAG